MKQYLLDRAREASTWRGIALLLTSAGVVLSPEQTDAIVAGGLAIAGLIGAFVPDKRA